MIGSSPPLSANPPKPNRSEMGLLTRGSLASSSGVAKLCSFLKAVKRVFINTLRPSQAIFLGKSWASFDNIMRAACQFEIVTELVRVVKKVSTLEKRVGDAEDSFVEMSRSIDELGAELIAKKAQLGETMEKLQHSEEKATREKRELKLILEDLL